MKTTKTILFTAVLTASFFSATLFTACTKNDTPTATPDPCAGVTCYNGGTCSSGTCLCPTGYTGTYCQTANNSGFAATWNGTNCNGNASYVITSSASNPFTLTIPVPLYISTACGGGITIYLTGTATSSNLFSTNTITVTTACGNIAVNAEGQLSGNRLTMTLNLATNSGVQQCVFNGSH